MPFVPGTFSVFGSGLRVWDAHTGNPLGPFRPAGLGYLGPEATWLAPEDRDQKSEVRNQKAPEDRGQKSEVRGQKADTLTSDLCLLSSEGLLRLSPDGKEARRKSEPTGPLRLVHFSADGQRMAASTSSSNVQQWDTRTGKAFDPALRHPEPTEMIRYSPDGKLLAVACLDDSVRLWDADTGWPLGPPLLHVDAPIGLTFSDENRTLLSITEAGIARAWPVPIAV